MWGLVEPLKSGVLLAPDGGDPTRAPKVLWEALLGALFVGFGGAIEIWGFAGP